MTVSKWCLDFVENQVALCVSRVTGVFRYTKVKGVLRVTSVLRYT